MRLVIPFSLVAAIAGSPTLSLAADYDEPYYRERDVVVERPAAPVVVERERIIERRYYAPREEVYVAPSYYAPRYYAPYAYNYPYAYGYPGYRAAYFARPYWWHRHYYRGW
jgi:hypothetical protein